MPRSITVALAGNPNAGKTTLFNAVTGARQHVGNWPGVTVEKKEGVVRHGDLDIHVVDLPGTYSLTAYSVEEIIARNFIVDSAPDVVVDVVDAANLERNLYLAVQLLEMGVKVVMALNMIDVAEGRQIKIDQKTLSQLLEIPVIPTNGKKGIGIENLMDAAVAAADSAKTTAPRRGFYYGTEVEEELAPIERALTSSSVTKENQSARWLAVKLLEGDDEIRKKIQDFSGLNGVLDRVEHSRKHLTDIFADPPEIIFTDARYGFIAGAIKQSVKTGPTDRVHLSEKIDKVLTNRLVGPIILLVVLYGLYTFTFQGSEPLVKYFETFFKWLGAAATDILPPGIVRSLIVSGIIDGVGGVLGFTPLIAFMFLAIAILEDTGYMARVAFMLDRVLRGFGLHGASLLALMVSGGLAGGCAVPGIMATRTLKEPKERLATILVAPLMNCGAKLPVYALLTGAFFPGQKASMMFLLTLISWSMALTAGKIIRSTVLAGPSAPFVLELPPYRMPTLRGLLIHTWERTWMYVKKAGTVILAVSVLIWAMMTFPELPEEKVKAFTEREGELTASFLANPQVASVFKSEKDLESFENLRSKGSEMSKQALDKENPDFVALWMTLREMEKQEQDPATVVTHPNLLPQAGLYDDYSKAKGVVEVELRAARLKSTIGGRVGVALEWVFKPIGFDWRTNVSLLGGFAAKEVVISTLGTAYSLGEVDPNESLSLGERLKSEPDWNPLMAFTLILFVMMYAPCFVTLVVIKRETGRWRWAVFAAVYTTILAYCVALAVHSVGSFFELGTS